MRVPHGSDAVSSHGICVVLVELVQPVIQAVALQSEGFNIAKERDVLEQVVHEINAHPQMMRVSVGVACSGQLSGLEPAEGVPSRRPEVCTPE